MKKGKLVTFEGGDGAGKSTQLKLLKDYLEKEKIEFIFTREPGGTEVSEKIRKILKSKENRICAECETLLYAAARAELVNEIILPALNEGKTVICDRFIDSSLAYQGQARGLGEEAVLKANELALKGLKPDLTFFLDIEPDVSFKRKGGADGDDRLENEGETFHRKIYECYINLAEQEKERIYKLNATQKPEKIHEEIIQTLKERKIID